MTARACACLIVGLATLIGSTVNSEAASCERLTLRTLRDARIDSAHVVAASAYVPPQVDGSTQTTTTQFADLPAFCRVVATTRPKSNAPVTIEVWLPVAGWNGRLRGIGNDGFYNAAPASIALLADALRAGYASVGSDGGRRGDASYILREPEQLTNYSYRATHEMTVVAKDLVSAFYGKGPSLSAVAECAGRGSTGLSSVQRYPGDYDAVAVGEFIGDSTRHMANQWWIWQALHQDEASVIPPDTYPVIQRAALAACDANDGAEDGIISDPPRCTFDPGVLACRNGDELNCLTAPQVTTLRKIYAGATNPRTGVRVAPPLMRGGELNWTPIVGTQPNPVSLAFFKYFVLRDANWDYKTRPVNFDTDIAAADKQTAALPINQTNPDVRRFVARGGKLLLYAGWSDPFVPPEISVDYYSRVVAAVGPRAAHESVRLFMVPGLRNCAGTAGAENFNFDAMSALLRWRESGKAPEEIVATRLQNGKEVGTRLVCAYPKSPVHVGTGDPRDARSFACR